MCFFMHSPLWCELLCNLPDYTGPHQKPAVTLRTEEFIGSHRVLCMCTKVECMCVHTGQILDHHLML